MPVLAVRDLKRTFPTPGGAGAVVAVDLHALDVEAGEQVGLAGASGSGKSTLLLSLAGILRADSGHIVVRGEDLTRMSESARDRVRARHIGLVFQTFNLLESMSALENVVLPSLLAGEPQWERARELLDRLDLSDRAGHRPGQLSVGQAQRVAVARALVTRPAVVLADEPTASLDPDRAAAAMSLLAATCRESGAALVVASHDRALLSTCDRVLDLDVPTLVPEVAP